MILSFEDTFSDGKLDETKWNVSEYTTQNYAGGGSAVTFSPSNIDFSQGCLCLILNQPDANACIGAEITSKEKFGYGRYQFSFRAGSTSETVNGIGSPKSGQVSSSFLIDDPAPNYISVTEIDAPEIEGIGIRSNNIEWDIWKNGLSTNPSPEFNILQNPEAAFHTYEIWWLKNKVEFYIDGNWESVCWTSPVKLAVIDFNFYGTNSFNWGGSATVGVTRYMYVNNVKYWSF